MVTMADTVFRAPNVEPVARAITPAAEYAEYKVLRDRFHSSVFGQLGPAIKASTLATLDGLPYPVKFRNQGALEEWRGLFTVHDWSRRLWDDWATPRATCLDCINELCWQVAQHLDRRVRHQRPSGWPDATFPTIVRWAANIHFERKCGALLETTSALDALLMQSDIDDTLPMQLFSPPFDAQYLQLNRTTAEHFRSPDDRISGPCGPARNSRKLIFVAPIPIHADRLDGQPPPPKAYELTTGRARNNVAVSGATTQRIQPARFPADSRQPLARAFHDRT